MTIRFSKTREFRVELSLIEVEFSTLASSDRTDTFKDDYFSDDKEGQTVFLIGAIRLTGPKKTSRRVTLVAGCAPNAKNFL